MDSRTLWAIILVGIVWFGWQQYINKKYGSQPSAVVSSKSLSENSDQRTQVDQSVSISSGPAKGGNIEDKTAEIQEQLILYSNPNVQLKISSKGMALKHISLTKFKGKDGLPIQFSGGDGGLFSTWLIGQKVNFKITDVGNGSFLGVAETNGIRIQKKMSFSENYRVDIETHFEKTGDSIISPTSVILEDDVKKVEKGSLFAPASETQEFYVWNQEGEKDYAVSASDEGIAGRVDRAVLASINGHYFSSAFIDKSDIVPDFAIDHKPHSNFLKGTLTYSVPGDKKDFTMKGIGFFGPKDISILESVDPILLKIVKFGFFSAIAKPLLITMKWFYGVVGNWGWSIILLTFLVRMIVMPLHIMSFRSMKAMQKVQPLIQGIRERYKDDPMALNRETMELMKKHKVNPLGGCLPMLLQIPVFFALYRVFSESIELYQSPFIFWIKDLSTKDPYFVLPVLMAAVMYLQQKMTPSTMDPAQARVMQFMPLIFSLMMISLPSALTLYMFVSTFFGILQQYFFLKDKHTSISVK